MWNSTLDHLLHGAASLRRSGLGDGGSDVDNNDIQGLLNDTDSELSGLSHVDAPDDVIYMVFGVIIAMLIAGVIIVLVAVTISKIRKREDSSVVDAVNVETPLPHQRHSNNHHHHHTTSNQQYHQNLQQQHQQVQQYQKTANGDAVVQQNNQTNNNNNSVWVFPPLPPQPNIYSVNHLALMQANNDHKNGFKGLKRQLSGRFKRMISRKPSEPPTPTIPPELKPQLKTIYVY